VSKIHKKEIEEKPDQEWKKKRQGGLEKEEVEKKEVEKLKVESVGKLGFVNQKENFSFVLAHIFSEDLHSTTNNCVVVNVTDICKNKQQQPNHFGQFISLIPWFLEIGIRFIRWLETINLHSGSS